MNCYNLISGRVVREYSPPHLFQGSVTAESCRRRCKKSLASSHRRFDSCPPTLQSICQIMNYSRFYSLFAKLPKYGDDDDQKAQLVSEISQGRTTSLRELSQQEYNSLCYLLEERMGIRDNLRRRRSALLRQMQQMGIKTHDWQAVDAFCLQPRIAGKPFRYLSLAELTALSRKLHAIDHKRPTQSTEPKVKMLYYKPSINSQQLPS